MAKVKTLLHKRKTRCCSGLLYVQKDKFCLLAHLAQHSCVLANGIYKCWHYLVWQSVLFGRAFYDLGDLRIMHMRNMGEQVVLYLVVKSAYEPEHPLAAW